ncbi:THC0290_0291 family protein [Flavivirga eckloniae]|uniref:Glutamate dehydrogenase n=1 Tax=Flavivirga eckloniae TaxID=1803846 RepID=A0A2K9PYI6_9FLAO|nr:glutamate dehydrogenase [Flavivirga eckloniae]AUP81597.1 glutamate dehydrogenase [Flavivirga eckloniae]
MKYIVSAFCMFVVFQTSSAQLGFSHEIGVIAGSLQLRSDYGIRENTKTNFGNSGFGVGLVHYLNFSYRADCNCYTTDNYFNDHFKLRNEISWNRTKLEHFGKFVDPNRTSEDAERLRSHRGVAKNLDIGTQLEFFPLSIRSFQSFSYRFTPFVSLGVHYTSYNPEVSTTYANPDPLLVGDVLEPSNFYSGWDPGSVDATSGSAWSLVGSIGVRYKLDKLSDLMLDFRYQHYFSDWVDGLNHQLDHNKSNDSLIWLNIGYIYYLN